MRVHPSKIIIGIVVLSALLGMVVSAPVAADSGTVSSSGPNSASPGDIVKVSFEVTNTGDSPSAYILDLSLPDGYTVSEHTDDSGQWKSGESKWLWQTIEPGASQSKSPTLELKIPEGASGSDEITADLKTASGIQQSTTVKIQLSENIGTPEAEIAATSVEEPVSAGDSFEVTFDVTNRGSSDASTGGIQFDTPPGVSANNVFFTDGISAGETKTRTVIFDVTSDVDPDDYTLTADATVGSTSANTTVDFTVTRPETSGIVDSSRTVQDSTVEPGDSIRVTVETNLADQGQAEFVENIEIGGRPVSQRNLVVTEEPTSSLVTKRDGQIVVVSTGADQGTVTLKYQINTPEDLNSGQEYLISGNASDGATEDTVNLGTDSVAVRTVTDNGNVQLNNLKIEPEPTISSESERKITFDVNNLSTDGEPDEITITMPNNVVIDSVENVEVNGENINSNFIPTPFYDYTSKDVIILLNPKEQSVERNSIEIELTLSKSKS